MNVMAYMSIARGYFAKRAAGEKLPEDIKNIYNNLTNDKIFEYASSIVRNGNYSFMDLAFMYIMNESKFGSVPLASFHNNEQLEIGIQCMQKEIPVEAINQLAALKKFVYH